MASSQEHPHIPILVSMLSNELHKEFFRQNGLPVFEDPNDAVSVAKALVSLKNNQETSWSHEMTLSANGIQRLTGVNVLTEYQAKRFLAGHGLQATREKLVTTPEDAVKAAESLGYPVVLKGISPEIMHKTDSGIVHLNLQNENDVKNAYQSITSTLKEKGSSIDGVLVQEMVKDGLEILIGVTNDDSFGPMITVGLGGGVFVEILKDTSTRLCPISVRDAEDMLNELHAKSLLNGFRGKPPADKEALVDTMAKISQIAVQYQNELQEIEINPLVVFEKGKGCKMLDALIRIK